MASDANLVENPVIGERAHQQGPVRRMGRSLIGAAFALAAIYGGLSILLAHLFTNQQNNTDIRTIDASPDDAGVPFEDVTFPAEDGLTISGWLISRTGSKTAVVMIPGGANNRMNRIIDPHQSGESQLKLMRALWERGHTLLVYDPRGTGRSEGDRLSYGFLEAGDLLGALNFLDGRGFAARHVGVIGWSMGTTTALYALARVTYGGLVADSAVGSFSNEEITNYVARVLSLPLALAKAVVPAMTLGTFMAARLLWGMHLGARAVDELSHNPVPVLVIHGRADSQITMRSGKEIALAAGDKLFAAHYLDDVDHCGAYASDPAWYVDTVCDAFDRMLR